MSDESVLFPEKYNKVLKELPEFKDTADGASPEELKKIIVQCEGNIYTIDKEKDQDVKLNAAKELVKEMSAPYRDAIKVQTAKTKYCLFLLEGKGENLDNKWMNVDRKTVKSCCGKKSFILIINKPIDEGIIKALQSTGYKELEHFTKSGILYVENNYIIATGPIGSNKLQIRCRVEDCEKHIDALESTLKIL